MAVQTPECDNFNSNEPLEQNEPIPSTHSNLPQTVNGPTPWRQVAFYLLVATAFLLHKKPDSFINPQFWAEDGATYFSDARTLGLKSIVKPYTGTYYLYLRLVAYTGNLLKPRYVPAYYNYMSLLVTLAVLVYVMRSRTNFEAKGLFAVAVVVSPHMGEVFLNLTNLHWIMALALLALIMSEDAQTMTGRLLECGLLVVLCLTGAFGLLFWPLFVIRSLRRKSFYSALILGLASLCALMELLILHADRLPGQLDIRNPDWIGFFGNRCAGFWFVGDMDVLGQYPNSLYFFGLTCSFVLLLIFLSLWYEDADGLCVLGAAGAVVAATAYAYRGDPGAMSPIGTRYEFVPTVAVVWCVLKLMRRSRCLCFPGCFLLALFMMSSASLPKCQPLPDLHWKEVSAAIDGPVACEAPVNPGGPIWSIRYVPKHH